MGEFGIKAAHAQISDTCRDAKGDDGAFVDAVEVLRKAYREAVEGRAGQEEIKYHLVLYVEVPRASSGAVRRYYPKGGK